MTRRSGCLTAPVHLQGGKHDHFPRRRPRQGSVRRHPARRAQAVRARQRRGREVAGIRPAVHDPALGRRDRRPVRRVHDGRRPRATAFRRTSTSRRTRSSTSSTARSRSGWTTRPTTTARPRSTTGDFAFVPADIVHAFQIHNTTKVFGVGHRRLRALLPRDRSEDRRDRAAGRLRPGLLGDARRRARSTGRSSCPSSSSATDRMPSILEIDFAQPAGFRPLSLDLRTPGCRRACPSSCSCTAGGGCAAAARCSRRESPMPSRSTASSQQGSPSPRASTG